MTLNVVTPWTPTPGVTDDVAEMHDPVKDRLYADMVRKALLHALPETYEVLVQVGATVCAYPGGLYAMHNGNRMDIPHLVPYLQLVPWREAGEFATQ